MKKLILLFLSICLIFEGCEEKDQKNRHTKKSLFSSLFKKKIETEHIDSLAVARFVIQNPDFEPYKNKMQKFYARRNYRLAWSEEGEFLPQASMFINLVQDMNAHGIKTYKNYHLREKYRETSEARKPHRPEISAKRKDMDLILTASYFQYAQEIWHGTVDPGEEYLGWHIDRKKIKYGRTLDVILANTESANPFQEFEPLHAEYHKLKTILAEYKKIDSLGGWPKIPLKENGKLQKGDTSELVQILRKRLWITKDLAAQINDSIFTFELEDAVKKFQQRHGLNEDGIVAGKTLQMLNIPVKARIEQLIVNMERWRWVPKKISQDYVVINIPEFRLHVFEKDKKIWTMNVIVGKAASQTPIFNDEIEYIVMSPTWNVPATIARDEIIPLIQKDSLYLQKFNMEVLVKNIPVDPGSVKWDSLEERDISNYSFRQNPGGDNALGKIKFIFPNEYDVYLHDTPTGRLFSQAERGFSHGCIRIQEPLKFAEYLLRNDPAWTTEKIVKAMNSGTEQYVKLKKKDPVYIVYFTAWMDENGLPQFREDLYGHDKKLKKAYFEN